MRNCEPASKHHPEPNRLEDEPLHPPWRGRACRFWRWTSRQSCKVALSAARSRSYAGQSTAWGRWRMPRHRLSGSPGLYLPCLLWRGQQNKNVHDCASATLTNWGTVTLSQLNRTSHQGFIYLPAIILLNRDVQLCIVTTFNHCWHLQRSPPILDHRNYFVKLRTSQQPGCKYRQVMSVETRSVGRKLHSTTQGREGSTAVLN